MVGVGRTCESVTSGQAVTALTPPPTRSWPRYFRTAGSPPCGGAVIAHPWLITFGTCVGDRTMQIVVHVGDTQRTTTGGIRVNRVVRHPRRPSSALIGLASRWITVQSAR
ncbi:trypsin-like serine protease [Streptomyces sp. CB01883]|uniref:trypsin-like serine protease n=1 Tax=Streptomyces sp. CB01883 TaxID=1703943 RepID=UPI003FD3F7B5